MPDHSELAGLHGLGANDFRALLYIMVAETARPSLAAGELAVRMGLFGAAITYLVERLIESDIRCRPGSSGGGSGCC